MIKLRNLDGGLRAQIVMATFGLSMINPIGKVFYVQSTHAAAGATGKSGEDPNDPMSTIVSAVALCTAGRGDVIVCLPGHVETIIAADQLLLNIAGVTIIGVGSGSARPTINFTTSTGSCVKVSAANVTLINLLFTGGIDALTGILLVQAADFKLIGCETRDVTGEMVACIITTAAADRLYIKKWRHNGATTPGGSTALQIVGGDGHIVEDFDIFGNFSVAAIRNVTTAMTNARIGGGDGENFIQNGLDNAAVVAITLVATSTGHVGPNISMRIGVDATSNTTNITEAIVGAAMQMFLPLNVANLGGEVAMAINITAATDA